MATTANQLAKSGKFGDLRRRIVFLILICLDLFFEHASTLFRFCVLFVVRDDPAHGRVAHGRNVNGLGAPRELVARLAIPLQGGGVQGPGVLGQAAELKRAIVVSPAADGADAMLIGTLGRAMPSAPSNVPASIAVPAVPMRRRSPSMAAKDCGVAR